jgi:hypothetical protein
MSIIRPIRWILELFGLPGAVKSGEWWGAIQMLGLLENIVRLAASGLWALTTEAFGYAWIFSRHRCAGGWPDSPHFESGPSFGVLPLKPCKLCKSGFIRLHMNLRRMGRKLAVILGIGTVFLLHSAVADSSGKPLMEWAVRVSQETLRVGPLPEGVGCSFRPLTGLPGYFVLEFKNAENRISEVESWLSDHPEILWFERQREDQLGLPNAMVGNPVGNPRFGDSWHLANAGRSRGRRGEDINVLPAWDAGYTGAGVLVAVVDEGTELTHPDLIENIRHDLALDLVNPSSPFQNLGSDEAHGTAVSGVIAARDNTIGGVGIAYGSHLVPIRYLGKRQTDATLAQALSHRRATVSIFNNSWGPTLGDAQSPQVAMLGPSTLGRMALSEGRDPGSCWARQYFRVFCRQWGYQRFQHQLQWLDQCTRDHRGRCSGQSGASRFLQ